MGNNADTDDDDDGVLDVDDAFPLDSTESKDTDNDGIGNNVDTDDDDDGLSDTVEDGATGAPDTDGDGIPNREDLDSDGDGYLDEVDLNAYDNTIQINLAPLANDGTVSVDEDGSILITLIATDDHSDIASYTVVANPTNGALSGSGNSLTYTPAPNFSGTDTFTFKATDTGSGGSAKESNTATVSITVNPVNDGPVITAASSSVTVVEDGSADFASLNVQATDAESDALTWTLSAGATNGVANVAGTGLSAPIMTYVPNANYFGSDSFDVQVADGNGGVDTITIGITVSAVNDAPVIGQGNSIAVSMDEDGSFLPPFIDALDIDSGTLTWSKSANASNGTATISGTGASPTISYSPASNFNGTDSFVVQVSDGTDVDDITVNVTVNPINDAPTITTTGPVAITMDEDGIFTPSLITATDNDPANTLTWSIATQASKGTATVTGTGANPTYNYAPNADENGSDSFVVQVSDGTTTDTITVSVDITPVADLPVISGSPAVIATEGVPYSFIPTASDADNDSLTFSIQFKPSWTIFDTATGELSGTPASGDIGTDSNILISVTGNGDTVNLAAFDITVSAAPIGGAVWDNFNWDDGSTWQ